jgi:hypothetical protein
MKIWLDKNVPAPESYSWRKSVDDTIASIETNDRAVAIGMRHGHACFLQRDYAGRNKCYEFANRHDIKEISISEELVGSKDIVKLRDYLVRIGRIDSCTIVVH